MKQVDASLINKQVLKNFNLESFIARVRSIEKGIITIEWYNSNGDLIGLKVEQGNLELFEQKKWTRQMHEFTKKFTLPSMSLASISLVLIFSLIISGNQSP